MTARRRYTATQAFVVDGIRYSITKHYDDDGPLGRTVDSPCGCFGSQLRCHNTIACPWMAKRSAGEPA